MAVTTYIIQPFVVAKGGGRLVPGTPQKAGNEVNAVAAAELMAGQVAGVIVLEEQSDTEQDIFAEPRPVRVIGRVSREMIASLAA